MRGAIVIVIAVLAQSVRASATTITGDVIDARSRWVADGTRIVTEATVRTAAGDMVVSQLGGSVDGIAIRTLPGPEPLVLGMRVSIAARTTYDLRGAQHLAVDDLRVLA